MLNNQNYDTLKTSTLDLVIQESKPYQISSIRIQRQVTIEQKFIILEFLNFKISKIKKFQGFQITIQEQI